MRVFALGGLTSRNEVNSLSAHFLVAVSCRVLRWDEFNPGCSLPGHKQEKFHRNNSSRMEAPCKHCTMYKATLYQSLYSQICLCYMLFVSCFIHNFFVKMYLTLWILYPIRFVIIIFIVIVIYI